MIPAGRIVTKIEGPSALTHGVVAIILPPKEKVVIASALDGMKNTILSKRKAPHMAVTDTWKNFMLTLQYTAL